MIRLKAEFPNADTALWPGQFVRIALLMETLPNAVVVPAEAVQTNPQGSYVFVVGRERTVALRPVVVDQASGSVSVQ